MDGRTETVDPLDLVLWVPADKNPFGVDDKDLAYWSFARYGRRGVFGARANVTHLRVRRDADGRCTLMRPG